MVTDLARQPSCSSSCGVRLTRLWVGRVRQEGVDGCVGEVGLEVTVQDTKLEMVRSRGKRHARATCLLDDFEACVCETHEDVPSRH